MASVSMTSRSTKSISWSVSGLQYPSSEYTGFRWLFNGVWSQNNSTSYTATGLQPSTSYSVSCEAQYQGVWYGAGSSTDTTLSPPPAPNVSVSSSSLGPEKLSTTTTISAGTSSGSQASTSSIVASISSGGSLGGSGAGSYSASGSSYNTTYTITAYALDSNGVSGASSSTSFTTGDSPLVVPAITFSNVMANSFSYSQGSNSKVTTYGVILPTGGESYGSTPRSGSMSNLSPATTYTLISEVSAPGYTTRSQSYSVTTSNVQTLTTPALSSISSTQSTISASISTVPNASGYSWQLLQSGFLAGDGSGTSVLFTGLKPGTTYAVRWKALGNGVTYADSPWGSTTQTTSNATPMSPPTPYGATSKYTGADLSWSSVTGAEQYGYEVYINDGSMTAVKSGTSTTTSVSVTGLSVNTSYKYRVMADDTDGWQGDSGWSSYSYFSTLNYPNPPEFDTSKTQKSGDTSITLYWSTVAYASSYNLQYKVDGTTTWLSAGSTTNTNQTVSGLTKGVKYNFRVNAQVDSISSGWVTGWSGIVSATAGLRPSDFAWTTTKISGETFVLTASEWNGFTIRINDFRRYKNLSDYTFSSAIAGETFMATQFNQAIYAIGEISGAGSLPSLKYSNDNIDASDLNQIVTALNTVA